MARRAIRLPSIVLAAFLGGCFLVPSAPQPDRVPLLVRVVGTDGNAVPNAAVVASGGWYYSGPRAIVDTDARGESRFQLLPTVYEITVYPPSFFYEAPARDSIDLSGASGEYVLELIVERSPPPEDDEEDDE